MSETVEELPTFLVPLQKSNILLPKSSVAEIIPYEPLQRIQDSPDWFLGLLSWRGVQVHVLSFEMLARTGASFSLMSVASASLVICTTLGGQEDLHYFALVAQALPRLMNLTAEELIESQEDTVETELSIVRLNGQPAVIPDLEYIESCLADLDFD
jgi:chemosensory pili system protein ChpC